MLLSEAFRDGGFWFRVGDYQFRFTCVCGVQQQLDACVTSERGDVTVYACPQCDELVAGVTEDPVARAGPTLASPPPDEDGHLMCGYVFGTKVDMELWPAAAVEPFLRIPRRPGFFTSRNLT